MPSKREVIIGCIGSIILLIILVVIYIFVFKNKSLISPTPAQTSGNVQGLDCSPACSSQVCADGKCVPKKIGAYLANWNYYRSGLSSFPPNTGTAKWSNPAITTPVKLPSKLDHLTYAFLMFDEKGVLSWNSPPFNGEQGIISNSTPAQLSDNPGMTLTAQSPPDDAILRALKNGTPNLPPLYISIGGFNFTNPKHYNVPSVVNWRYLVDDNVMKTFLEQLKSFTKFYGIAGIDIDWEYPQTEADKYTLTKIMTAIKNNNPSMILTMAIPINPTLFDNYDFASLNSVVDGYNLMAYDIAGNFGSPAGTNIFGANTDINYILKTIDTLSKLIPIYKLSVGLASYGRSTIISTTDNISYQYDKDLPYGLELRFMPDGSTSDQSCMSYYQPGILSGDYASYSGYSPSMKNTVGYTGCLSGPFSKTPGYLSYYEIMELISNPPKGLEFKVLQDYTNTMTEVLAVNTQIANNVFVVSYDSPKTIALKRQKIESMFPNIAGFFMWQLGDDDFVNGFPLSETMISNSESKATGNTSYGTGYGNMFINEDPKNYTCSKGVVNNGLDCPDTRLVDKSTDFAISQCCSNINADYCYNPYSPGSDSCVSKMSDFCQDKNLLTDQCNLYCLQNDCSDALQKFCQTGYQNVGDPNYSKTCSCHQTAKFYNDWKSSVVAGNNLSPNVKSFIDKSLVNINPNCDFPSCSMDRKSIKSGRPNCSGNALQICMQQANVNMDGNVLNSTIDNNKFVECMKKNNSPITGYPVPLPIVIGITGVLIAIIIGFLVFTLLQKQNMST